MRTFCSSGASLLNTWLEMRLSSLFIRRDRSRDGSILPLCSTRRVQEPLRVMAMGVLAVFVRQNGARE